MVDAQSSSTTSVHGGGGQNNTPVHISSTTTTKLHLFVREDDGTEFDNNFIDSDVAVRTGHRVSVVFVGRKGANSGYAAALAVHATGRTAVFPARVENFIARMEPWLGCLAVVGIAIAAATVFAALVNAELFLVGFGMGLVGAIFWMFRRKQRHDALVKVIVDTLKVKLREAIEQEKGRANAG